MSREFLEHTPHDLEVLFAVEREIVAQSEAMRRRALQRARASLPRNARTVVVSHVPGHRRFAMGKLAAAAVFLFTLCALAFYAGYQARSEQVSTPARAPSSAPAALLSTDSQADSAVSAHRLPSSAPVPGASAAASAHPLVAALAKAPTAKELMARELRVLRPAQRAVARGDFASALAPIEAHRRQFPAGRLAEEREALHVKALVGLGRTAEARRRGAAFRARFPRSALLGSIDEMLESPN